MVASRAELSPILTSTVPGVIVFEAGKYTQAQIETVFKKYKGSFSFDNFRPLRVQEEGAMVSDKLKHVLLFFAPVPEHGNARKPRLMTGTSPGGRLQLQLMGLGFLLVGGCMLALLIRESLREWK